jgi:hypothetical protein
LHDASVDFTRFVAIEDFSFLTLAVHHHGETGNSRALRQWKNIDSFNGVIGRVLKVCSSLVRRYAAFDADLSRLRNELQFAPQFGTRRRNGTWRPDRWLSESACAALRVRRRTGLRFHLKHSHTKHGAHE